MSGLKGVEITDIAGLSQPVTKLVEVVFCGIGKLYEPTHIVRMAKAKAKEIEILSSAVNKNFNLPLKYDDGKVLIDSTRAEELIKRTGNRLVFQEINKQQNIDSVISNAYENLKEEKTVSEEPVDKDWILRFFNSVGDISNQEMQKIWGKILAGEIKKPNTFSLRTLEILKNLTQKEAELFTKISEFVMQIGEKYFIPEDLDLLLKYDVKFKHILILEECGLIKSNLIEMTTNVLKNAYDCIRTYDLICIFRAHSNVKLSIAVYRVTEPGQQLLQIMEKKSNKECYISYFKNLKNKIKDCSISVHQIKKIISDSQIEHADEDLIIDG